MIYKPICLNTNTDDLFPLPHGGEDGKFNRQLLGLLHRLLFLAADSSTFVWTGTVKRCVGGFTLT